MAKLNQLARPMMCRPARLDPNQATRQRSEELQQLVALDRLGHDNAPQCVDAVNLEDVLGQVEANGRDRRKIGDSSVRRLRKKFTDAPIAVCLWGAVDLSPTSEAARADATVNSLAEAIDFCARAINRETPAEAADAVPIASAAG
jgi:hypothetical protein